MDDIIIISQKDVAGRYGIGTYLEELTFALKDQYVLHIVDLYSGNKAFEVKQQNNLYYYLFPAPIVMYQGENYKYIQSCLSILLYYIDKNKKVLFLLNSIYDVTNLKYIKKKWPFARLFSVVHYFNVYDKITAEELDFYKWMDHIICLSKNTRDAFLKLGFKVDTVSFIPNGLSDRKRTLSKRSRTDLRMKKFISPSERILLFVGRVDLFKGITHVLESFRMFVENHWNWHLFIVGDGGVDIYMKQCQDVWSKISFTGKLEKEQLDSLYKIADIGIIPSWHEQCSYVAIEMMMYGIPTIVADTPGLSEMFIEEYNAIKKIKITARVENTLEESSLFKDALQDCIEKTSFLERISSNARKTYEKKYNSHIFSENYMNLFEKYHFSM